MGKHKITILTILGFVVVFLVVIHFSLQKDSEKLTLNKDVFAPNDLVITSIIDKDDEYNKLVRTDVQNGNIQRTDSMGIDNSMPSDYNDSYPLIEICTFERILDGSIKPLYLEQLAIDSQRPKGELISGGNYFVNGFGKRVGLDQAEKLDGGCDLQWDTEYSAKGAYYLDDPNDRNLKKTSELRFRTPKSLGPGEIYRVDLVLVDRIKEQQEKDLVRIAKEEIARIEKEETITLQISEFPKYDESFIWSARYHDGNIDREFTRNDSSFILKGPNKLGGELVIHYFNREVTHVWLYVSNVQKRILNLPEDASIVINEANMISTRVSLSQINPNILSECQVVAFLPNENSKYCLFKILLQPEDLKKIQANNWQVDMDILPGTYYVKMNKDLETSWDLGVVKFTNEPGKTYSLSLK